MEVPLITAFSETASLNEWSEILQKQFLAKP